MNKDPKKSNEDNRLDIADELASVANELADTASEIEGVAGTEMNVTESDTIAELESKLAEAEKQTLMAQADMQNYRKRAVRDHQEQLKYASMGLMADILQVADNLDRAIQSAENEADATALLEGVKMVSQQISQVLESHGCKKIETVGKEFDPNLHEAIQMQPSDDFEPNQIMIEVRSGYKLHERIVRPAQVFVSTGKPK